MRLAAALWLGGLIASFALPAAAQDASPVTATVEDAERVYLTFETIDLLAQRCATETQEHDAFDAAKTDWLERNAKARILADRILLHHATEVDGESLAPRAEEDAAALLESIVPKPELCRSYLARMNAGEMDLKAVVPDLYSRLVVSDGAIAAMSNTP